jgi:predicted nucleotidyltransferase
MSVRIGNPTADWPVNLVLDAATAERVARRLAGDPSTADVAKAVTEALPQDAPIMQLRRDWETIAARFKVDNDFPLEGHVVGAFVVGSESHGTRDPDKQGVDDRDYMLVVCPPQHRLLGLHAWEHWRLQTDDGIDVVAYGLAKWTRMLLGANPNVLGTLFLRREHVLLSSAALRAYQEHRGLLLGPRAVASHLGYAQGQMARMRKRQAYEGYMGAARKALFDKHGYDPKNAAHLVRLARMGAELAEGQDLRVWRGGEDGDAAELLAIKRGEWPLERVLAAVDAARERLAAAPPDTADRADAREHFDVLLIATARGMVTHGRVAP